MNKCWFVLRQTHYPAPEYTHPGKAFGAAKGPILLGSFIPSHRELDNVINPDAITPFPKGMRIWTTNAVDFRFSHTGDKGVEAGAKAAAPVAAAAGVMVGAEAGAVFKRVMGDVWEVEPAGDADCTANHALPQGLFQGAVTAGRVGGKAKAPALEGVHGQRTHRCTRGEAEPDRWCNKQCQYRWRSVSLTGGFASGTSDWIEPLADKHTGT